MSSLTYHQKYMRNYMKKYRQNEKYQRIIKRYWGKVKCKYNQYMRYSDNECKIILAKDMSDEEIAKLLKRTMKAINIKRMKLKRKMCV